MLGAYLLIALCAVMEVVAVSVLGELLPLGRHLCRCLYIVVLGTEIVAVVGSVDLLNVV